MDEEFDTSVDTSDVDTSADMDTSDVVDDVPDDIPDDIPEDVPEDEPEIAEENDLSDDIPEDVPEDEPEMTEEDDLSEDIPEDVPEDEPELTEENDLSDDIPEDVPEDEPEMTEEDDLSEDIPEDVPEDEPELTEENDLSEDIPEDVPEDEPEMMEEDDLSEDIPEDVPEDKPEMTEEDDLSDDIPEDVPEDEPELTEEDDLSEDIPEDVPEDEPEMTGENDLTEDVPEDAPEDGPELTEENDLSENIPEDIPGEEPEMAEDDASEDTSEDAPEDGSEMTEDNDLSEDIPEDTGSNEDVGQDESYGDEVAEDVADGEVSEENADTEKTEATEQPEDVPKAEAADEAADTEDVDTVDQTENVSDAETTDVDNFSEASEINSISDYMNAHNYGPDDFAIYAQDPQWRQLMRQEYPDYELPEMTQESANAQLSQYMNDHNYGVDDYAEYSQDPIWRELHATAFPDDELPPLQNMSEDEFAESSESGIPQSADTVNAEMAESAFNQELGREFEENILSDPELTPEQKELMLGNFDEANRSDISTENAEVQTGNLMSDILKPSHFDDADSVSDIQEASPFNNAMEKSNSVIDRYEKVRNNTALMNDETGYQIAMNEMSKDLEKQVTDIGLAISENDAAVKVAEEALRNYSPEMETSPLNDSKYREIVENLQNTRDQSNRLRSQKGYLEALKNEASAEVSDEFKEMTFRSPGGKSFTDTFSELINEQGAAYPDEIVNDCGVCTMGNMANQHGGKFTEKSGLSAGFGEYNYTQITDEMSPDEKAYALDHNGLTSLDSQANILNKMGYEAVKYENGASFDDIVDHISKGNSMSLNLYGRDLNSGSDIAKRPGRIAAALSGQQSVLPANHAVTIAGLAVNQSGNPIGFFVNDTGGYGGKNNPSIFVSKAKYDQMLKRTAGISSIVCTGKKAFA